MRDTCYKVVDRLATGARMTDDAVAGGNPPAWNGKGRKGPWLLHEATSLSRCGGGIGPPEEEVPGEDSSKSAALVLSALALQREDGE